MASDERVEALVYVAALAPDEGETLAEAFYRDESHEGTEAWARCGRLYLDARWELSEAFAQNATAEQR